MKTFAQMIQEDTERDNQMQDMYNFFKQRTNNHIKLVQKYAEMIESEFPELDGVYRQTIQHDKSKFEEPEYEPYVHITHSYRMKKDGKTYEVPEDIKDDMSLATEHHVKHNRHHPEFHNKSKVNLINRDDRDKPPTQIIDATHMPTIDLAEMLADWLAMSEEKGTNPIEFAKANINIRWKFSPEQVAMIYEIINLFSPYKE